MPPARRSPRRVVLSRLVGRAQICRARLENGRGAAIDSDRRGGPGRESEQPAATDPPRVSVRRARGGRARRAALGASGRTVEGAFWLGWADLGLILAVRG